MNNLEQGQHVWCCDQRFRDSYYVNRPPVCYDIWDSHVSSSRYSAPLPPENTSWSVPWPSQSIRSIHVHVHFTYSNARVIDNILQATSSASMWALAGQNSGIHLTSCLWMNITSLPSASQGRAQSGPSFTKLQTLESDPGGTCPQERPSSLRELRQPYSARSSKHLSTVNLIHNTLKYDKRNCSNRSPNLVPRASWLARLISPSKNISPVKLRI